MDENARIDYFRSEMKGEMAKLEKLVADHRAVTDAAFRALETRIEKMVHDLKYLQMSVNRD
jgi:hypothetical protein